MLTSEIVKEYTRMKKYILYNPIAGNGKVEEKAKALSQKYPDAVCTDMSKIKNYKTFMDQAGDADLILCGGDGTLNRFINDIRGVAYHSDIYYYGCGSGNDFLRDLGKQPGDEPVLINEYIKELPTVTVNGKEYAFLNGIGYGIDGYCCEVGDKLREENRKRTDPKPINYTMIAIKGLLFHFKPRNAVMTVDGKEYKFKKAWLAPTMNGKYYGGGMMPAPVQDRQDPEKKISVMVLYGTGKLRTLMIFPSIFNGGHIKHTKHVTMLSGKNITVSFDEPTALQIDGETILGVTSYTAASAVTEKEIVTA